MDGPTLSLTVGPEILGDLDDPVDFLLEASHPETIRSVVRSGLSVSEWLTGLLRGESALRGPGDRFVLRILPQGIAAAGFAYMTHENGHIHHLFHLPFEPPLTGFQSDLDGLISVSGGINATQRAAEEILLEAPGDLSAHLAYLVFKLDLPAYVAVQWPLIGGDVEDFLGYRRDRNGTNETGHVIGLALWETLGLLLPWQGSFGRVIDYYNQGRVGETDHEREQATLSTTGYLSPVGALYGARLTTYLDRRDHRPGAFMTEVWFSPTRQGKRGYPVGALLGVRHFPLIGDDHLRLEAGADYTFFYEDADWGDERGTEVWEPVVQAGALSLHLAGNWGEVSLKGRCKERGFLPNERYQGGCEALFGVQFETGELF